MESVMSLQPFIDWATWSAFGYFIASHGSYLVLNIIAISGMRHRDQRRLLADLPQVYSGLEPPVSVLLTTHHGETGIVEAIQSLLQLNYPQFEVIVINDGTHDITRDILTTAFDLLPFPEAYRIQLATQPVTRIYRSIRYPNLRIIDKEHGNRADALNVGINASRYPLICGIDCHTSLCHDGLQHAVTPFLNDITVVATAGAIRLESADDATLAPNQHTSSGQALSRFQLVASLRNFVFAPLGWSSLNAMLVAPTGVHVLRKEVVIEAGGYRTDAQFEDMDLIMRMHRLMRTKRRAYRVKFVADVVGRQKTLATWQTLKMQNILRQPGLADSLSRNSTLLIGRRGGLSIRIAFLFLLLFECFGPLIEVLCYALIVIAGLCGIVAWQACAAFFSVAIGLGILLSVSSLLLEESTLHIYSKSGGIGKLMLAAIVENFGYRQLNAYWRALGLVKWVFQGNRIGG